MDFAIALLLFTFTLVVYFSYANNFQKQEKSGLGLLVSDAKALSSSLVLSGYPSSWDNTTVIRIGIADEQKINATKVKLFKVYDYKSSKKKFGTHYDFLVFFLNNKGEVININGVCAIGYPTINVSYNIRSAYYYQDDVVDFKLRDFMNETLKADIYFKSQTTDIYGLYGLISNLSKYQLVMMEHPVLSGGDYNAYKDKIENYSSTGGILLISGELASAQGKNLVGAEFYKKSGQSVSDRNATINNTDKYISFSIGDSFVFAQAYYVNNITTIDFKQIATFNSDQRNAISKWSFGNGTVYFFSDFDVSYFSGDFVGAVKNGVTGLIEGTCDQINVTGLPQKNLVKVERYLSYNSKVTKMVVYLWQ